ncbi:MAG: M28 family peptidase [Bdellovibrionaceae bacterium]|nr:M28 family peptidase [Pseudobdellovibrionaceae bacterium]
MKRANAKASLLFAMTVGALAALPSQAQTRPPSSSGIEVFSDLRLLRAVGASVLAQDARLGLGYARLDAFQIGRLVRFNHAGGKCAGYEVLPPAKPGFLSTTEQRQQELNALAHRAGRDMAWSRVGRREMRGAQDPKIAQALTQLEENNLRQFVGWASAFPNRDNRVENPNTHVEALAAKLRQLGASLRAPIQVDLIDHKSTKQKSIRVRVPGTSRAQEVVVLGAHFDSISFWRGNAPGADDNASGSANIFDVLRVLLAQGPSARTVEFYWYAGEESGLLGSAEIAKDAKANNRQIIGVLQLDMTLFPGNGEMTIGNTNDYTSSWLREKLVGWNQTYALGARIVDDRCGYACSDHASWYRQGYATLMPFEATMDTMNSKIHSPGDVVSNQLSFRHSMIFSKIGLIFAMELANSGERQPY